MSEPQARSELLDCVLRLCAGEDVNRGGTEECWGRKNLRGGHNEGAGRSVCLDDEERKAFLRNIVKGGEQPFRWTRDEQMRTYHDSESHDRRAGRARIDRVASRDGRGSECAGSTEASRERGMPAGGTTRWVSFAVLGGAPYGIGIFFAARMRVAPSLLLVAGSHSCASPAVCSCPSADKESAPHPNPR